MKKHLGISALFIFAFCVLHAQNEYQYQLDLVNVVKDRVKVTLVPPKTDKSELMFVIPRVIPGSYAIKDYGRFITGFTAYDAAGKKLKAKQSEYNKFFIYNATGLSRIEYYVNDTWDDKNRKNFVFQPGGSNIEAGVNYVVNPHCFFGYFEGYKMNPFRIEITKPEEMYGSGYLTKVSSTKTKDVLTAPDYVFMADNPMMYCKPDTASFSIGNCDVKISVYSATGVVSAKQINEYLSPIAEALREFLKGLPVSEYHFIYYFEDPMRINKARGPGLSSGYGALEHNHSSFYYLPESASESDMKSTVQDVSAHEFLHLLTPLNLHSEEIANFDFLTPKMSKHLWMYEGVTEYFSHLVQLQGGIVTEKQFKNTIRSKVIDAEDFGNFSMTEMSKQVLEPKYQELYLSVYSKGAVLAMLLDIHIASLTKGEKNLRTVMMDLAAKYGPERPFNDEELFKDIIAFSHPGVQEFIDAYVVGDTPPDMSEYFSKIGWDYAKETEKEIYISGSFGLRYDAATSSFVFTGVGANIFGVQNGDVLLSIGGSEVTLENLNDLFYKYFRANLSSNKIPLAIKRNGSVRTISGTPQKTTATLRYYFGEQEGELTESQKQIRQAVMRL